MKILVAEDEPKVAAFLKEGLEQNGYDVEVAHNGADAKALALENKYDAVVLDVMMPKLSGIEVCREIKNAKPGTPVLLLTALNTTEDKLSGFEAGTDDYLVKPFEFKELLARLKVMVRRNMPPTGSHSKLKVADLELDLTEKIAIRQGRMVELTPKEFALLEYFMRNKGKVLTKADIAAQVWDIQFDTGTNVVEVFVNMLRKKIDKDFKSKLIHTRIGIGYLFKED